MSYETWMNPPKCHYRNEVCGFYNDDVTCEFCSGYAKINCKKCTHRKWYYKDRYATCELDGHVIVFEGHVCKLLNPNCRFCNHVTVSWSAGFAHYGCELNMQGKGDFDVQKVCNKFDPNNLYLEWRAENPEPRK